MEILIATIYVALFVAAMVFLLLAMHNVTHVINNGRDDFIVQLFPFLVFFDRFQYKSGKNRVGRAVLYSLLSAASFLAIFLMRHIYVSG